tara:strand:- start:1356 stop:1781 length:426 start_codon:yes stop_codon:yes gene_type:complete
MEPAGFFRRIFSLIYDTLFVLAIVISLSLLLNIINNGAPKPGTFLSIIQLIIATVSGPLFYCYFWHKNEGQTLGMQAWKIKLVTCEGEALVFKTSLTRCFLSFISFLIIGLGYFWIIIDKKNRSWSDIFTNTRVIDIRKSL